MKTITNKFKIAVAGIALVAIGTANAQTVPGAAVNIVKSGNATAGTNNTSVRVVDNKGTIKYLQSNNGITSFTNTTANRTTTTFQLGGTLTDDTYIDVDGNAFALDGIARVDTTAETAADNAGAATLSDHGDALATGYTLLVRDEATGATKKLLISDLIESAQTDIAVNAAQETANTIAATLAFDADIKDILVFRNGAKLRAGIDYTVVTTALTIAPPAAPGTNQDWILYEDDIVEIHYSK